MTGDPNTPPQMPPVSRPTPPGLYDRSIRPQISRFEIIATVLSALWLLVCAVYFLIMRSDEGETTGSLVFVMTLMAVFFPVAMIWVGATAARASQIMRQESTRLQTAIDAIRQAYIAQSQSGVTEPSITRKLDEIAATTRKAEAALAVFTSSRPAQATAAPAPATAPDEGHGDSDQPTLALGTPADAMAAPLPAADFIRALNFPETAEDADGFAALRRALKDRSTAQLVQASQDVLTLMSQDGIYMDDLRPDLAKVEIWRAFADGERGRAIAPLGGVRDRSSLALAYGRMKQDPIFRDAAHHFLRVFDKTYAGFADRASDVEIQSFASTRTARAFMLLGRIAGTFD